MTSSLCFNLATGAYFASMVLFVVYLASRINGTALLANLFAYAGLVVHTAAIGLRWYESYQIPGGVGHAPLSNLYESVVFFAWTIILIYLLIDLKYHQRAVGAFVVPFAFVAMIWGQLRLNDSIEPLVPALQSNWLISHVVTCFVGYAAFAVSFGVSFLYLFKVNAENRTARNPGGLMNYLPASDLLDEVGYKTIAIGFPLLTIGIITGAFWANVAWGTYWSWDPKETWSLIVWLIYAAYLHARITKGWRGKKAAVLSIVGFSATIFCYLGVNLILSGLHSYGGTQ